MPDKSASTFRYIHWVTSHPEPFLNGSKEDEEEMEKEQKRKEVWKEHSAFEV